MRAPPSEATTLDERIARDCARSGVPFHVAADHLVDRVAAWVELALEVLDNEERDQRRRATVRHQQGQGSGGFRQHRRCDDTRPRCAGSGHRTVKRRPARGGASEVPCRGGNHGNSSGPA